MGSEIVNGIGDVGESKGKPTSTLKIIIEKENRLATPYFPYGLR